MKKIFLTQNKVALVDDEDYEYLNQWKWYAHKKGKKWYAESWTGYKIKMHTLIMNTPINFEVDHKDHNGLNNQKYNLRICTHSQNVKNSSKRSDNTSGYKGVFWYKQTNKWAAGISVNNKRIHLGYFEHKEDAAKAYNIAAIEHHGEFAQLNILEEK